MNNWRWAGVGLAVFLVLSSTSAQAQERKKRRRVSEADVRGAVTRYLKEVRPKALLPFLPLVDVQVSGITYKRSRDGDRLNWRVQGKVALTSREQKTVEDALLALLEAALVGRKHAVFSEPYYRDRVEATITIVPAEGPGREKLPPVVGKKETPAPVPAAPVVVFVPVPVIVLQPGLADCTWWQPPASGSWYEPPAFGPWWVPPPCGTWWQMCPPFGY